MQTRLYCQGPGSIPSEIAPSCAAGSFFVVTDDADPAEPTTPVITSIQDLMEILGAITADGREVWYRGHRDRTWQLSPSAFRTSHHADNERAMLARFRQEAAAAGLQYSFDDWGWITFAQHHALPTRLLDWSQTPLVALFFACEQGPVDSGIETDGEFFLLHPHDLNQESGDDGGGHPPLLSDGDSTLQNYLPGRDLENKRKPLAVVAPLIFDRIRFQTGTFTVTQRPPATTDAEPLRKTASLQAFTIPAASKTSLREQLSVLGFNAVSIYRDLDRIALGIKKTYGRRVS